MTMLKDNDIYRELSQRYSDRAILSMCRYVLMCTETTPKAPDGSIPIELWPSSAILWAIDRTEAAGIHWATTQIAALYDTPSITQTTMYNQLLITACILVNADRKVTAGFFEPPSPQPPEIDLSSATAATGGVVTIQVPQWRMVLECNSAIADASAAPPRQTSIAELLHTPSYIKWICERLVEGEPATVDITDTVAELAPVASKDPATASLSDCVNALVQRKIIATARPGMVADMLKDRIYLRGSRVVFLTDDPTDRQCYQSLHIPSSVLDTVTVIARNDELHLIGIPGWCGVLVVRIQHESITATGTEILSHLSALLRP